MNKLTKSNRLHKKGTKYLFEATHFTQPILDRGKGSWVWDVDGNKYLDLNAGQFCMSFGHDYKPFIDCVNKQLKKIYHTNTSTLSKEVIDGAKDLSKIMGKNFGKTLFLSTGSEANECAIRYSKFITKRNGVISLDYGYHGLTLGSQSSTMAGKWSLPKVSDTYAVKTPDYIHSSSRKERDFINECIIDLEKCFEKNGDKCAAFILEPIIGVGGMVKIPKHYLQRVRYLCDKYKVVLIYDECQCGFGRTGKWFAYQEFEIEPDIIVSAKAMGLGLPISAVTFSYKIAKEIDGKLVHFSSHQNDPLSSAITSFTINEIKNKKLLKNNITKGKHLLNVLVDVCNNNQTLCNPRGFGLMAAFDIDEKKVPNYRDYSNKLCKEMEKNGVLIQAVRQGRTFRIMPNYMIKDSEIDYLHKALIESLKEINH